MTKKRDDCTVASDGLPARKSGSWAKEKLSFLDQFVPPALQATTRKPHRYYVDLFAGPGINVNEETGQEFEGSALRALKLTAPKGARASFTHATLVNLNATEDAALRARVARSCAAGNCGVPTAHIEFLNDDANHAVHRIMNGIPSLAYAFVIADIEKPNQLPWDTVRALKSHGHQSVDLFVLFPLAMGLNRLLPYDRDGVEVNASALERFYGCDAWRRVVEKRVTDARSPDLRRELQDLYMQQLRALGWVHVIEVRDVKRRGDAQLYKMLYASNHPAGLRIAEWSASQPRKKDQLDLF